jgi:hypothetical protein
MAEKEDWGLEGLDDLEQELESISSISPDNNDEDSLNRLDNEKELEEYGVWVKVGPETIHDNLEIDLDDDSDEMMDTKLEDLDENELGDIDESDLENNLEENLEESLESENSDETLSASHADLDFKPDPDGQDSAGERTGEPLGDIIEEPLSEDINWEEEDGQFDEEAAPPSDAGETAFADSSNDTSEEDLNEIQNSNEDFTEIDLSAVEDEVDLPEITSESRLGINQETRSPADKSVATGNFSAAHNSSFSSTTFKTSKTSNQAAPEVATSNILEQIERELFAIKNELAGLKRELTLIREGGHEPADIDVQPVSQESSKGFFDEDDDEVVALTGDELDNILETADIMEEEGKDGEVSPEDEISIEFSDNNAIEILAEPSDGASADGASADGAYADGVSADGVSADGASAAETINETNDLPAVGDIDLTEISLTDDSDEQEALEANELSDELDDSLGDVLDDDLTEISLSDVEDGEEPLDLSAETPDMLSSDLSGALDDELEEISFGETTDETDLTGNSDVITDEILPLDIPEELDITEELEKDGAAPDSAESTDLQEEIQEESDNFPVEHEEELATPDEAEYDPDGIAISLPEEESIDDEEITLDFPEDLEDGEHGDLTVEAEELREAEDAEEKEITLESFNQSVEENESSHASTNNEGEDITLELGSFDEVNGTSTDEASDFSFEPDTGISELDEGLDNLELEIVNDEAEALETDSSHTEDKFDAMSLELPEEIEIEIETEEIGNENDQGVDDLEAVDLDAEAEGLTDTETDVLTLGDLDLEIHEESAGGFDNSLTEPEDLTLELSEEDQEPGEPEEVSLELPDDLEVEEETVDTVSDELSGQQEPDFDQSEEITLTLGDEEDLTSDSVSAGESDGSDDLTLEALDDTALDPELVEEAVDSEGEEITLELPDENSSDEELEEIELEASDLELTDSNENDDNPLSDLQPLEDEELETGEEPPQTVAVISEKSGEKSAKGKDVDALPKNLKEEIKTVLTYMDQLLESLPEDKIEEFAKSAYFETYKKLFEDLGIVN